MSNLEEPYEPRILACSKEAGQTTLPDFLYFWTFGNVVGQELSWNDACNLPVLNPGQWAHIQMISMDSFGVECTGLGRFMKGARRTDPVRSISPDLTQPPSVILVEWIW
jgi:hypothetical protein